MVHRRLTFFSATVIIIKSDILIRSDQQLVQGLLSYIDQLPYHRSRDCVLLSLSLATIQSISLSSLISLR